MKLRNLLFGTMIACAFASCSNEEDPIANGGLGEEAEGPATLSIKIDNVQTKAADTDISTLSVLIFKGHEGDPKLEKIGSVAANELEVTKIPITSGNKKILVLANVPTDAWTEGATTGTPLSTVLAATKDFANEVDGQLSMNSKVYTANVRVSVDNYLGYSSVPAGGNTVVTTDGDGAQTVKLYRNVAKVVLNSIVDTNPAEGFKDGRLDVKGVFVLHGNKTTKLAATTQWGATEVTSPLNYLNGYLAPDTYEKWVAVFTGTTKVPVYQYLTGDNYEAEGSYAFEANKTTVTTHPNFYVYENTNETTQTLLVVKGDYSYKGVNGETVIESNRYYPVAVGFDGITGTSVIPSGENFSKSDRTKVKGVLRNLKYVISMNVTGPGYETPFGPKPDGGGDPDAGDTFLNVKCEVVGFSDVIQNPGTIE